MDGKESKKFFDALGVEPVPLVVIIPPHLKGLGDSSASDLFGKPAGEICNNPTAIIPGTNMFSGDQNKLAGTTQQASCEQCKAPFEVIIPKEGK